MTARFLTVKEVAAASQRHEDTVREALRGGELVGRQRVKGGSWRVREDWLEAWLSGEEVAA